MSLFLCGPDSLRAAFFRRMSSIGGGGGGGSITRASKVVIA